MRAIARLVFVPLILLGVPLRERPLLAGPLIEADTTWSGDRTIADEVVVARGTLSIEPGTRITFAGEGRLTFRGGSALSAGGTPARPITLTAARAGSITGAVDRLALEHCTFTGLGPVNPGAKAGTAEARRNALELSGAGEGFRIRSCQFRDCGGAILSGQGACELVDCDLRNSGIWIFLMTSRVGVRNNTVRDGTLWFHDCHGEVDVRENILIEGTIWMQGGRIRRDRVRVESNYIHNPRLNGRFGLLRVPGLIRGNVLRGGTWTTCGIGGRIVGNVIEALSPAEIKESAAAGFKDQCTHENIGGLQDRSVVARNILINPSYGAIMGAAEDVCSDCVIRNNTFDLRGGTAPLWLNHLPEGRPRNLVVRNNLFLRTGWLYDEAEIPDSIASVDHNLWAGTDATSPSAVSASRRFVRIKITGKQEGDEGFGRHDRPPRADQEARIDPRAVVEEPDYVLPFTDGEMLARKHTVTECLDLYRRAYQLKAGSAAIDAGSPEDGNDPEVKDGRCDLGAHEHAS